ncbi:MAG: HNH endonuclease [Herpetosiphonaceae bacterium]|nr:MAG: HNH endonuclease [Herpetosiphonaceae bacterium]
MEMNSPVLVLNYNYEPINICNARRALVLVLCGKAEVLDYNQEIIHTSFASIRCPSVIRLSHLIRRPMAVVKLSRREIFRRDNYSCQYCGIQTHDLTLDHIIPRHRGGQHTWENLVSACRVCNHRKGGRTPEEARMRLRRQPFQPPAGPYYAIERRLKGPAAEAWRPFLPASLYEQV